MSRPIVLMILDGWGMASEGPGNAVALASTPNFDKYWAVYPKTKLIASGEQVGLPKGESGNSETGHLNLGAGQIVFQDLPRINMAIADGTFFQISAFKQAVAQVRKNNSSLHLLGLMGSGGVHSSNEHLTALVNLAKKENLGRVYLHLFTDGRDSPANSAVNYILQIEAELKKIGLGQIATLCGRYFAMDRDNRWERTQKAYEALVLGKGLFFASAVQAINDSYTKGKTDEFIDPIILDKKGLISDHDSVIFFNFRIDRPRQLTKAFVLPDFETLVIKKAAFDPYAEKYGLKLYEVPEVTTTFKREKKLTDLFFVSMTQYEKGLPVAIAFPPEPVGTPFARILSENSLRQLHISETEKERFVTYHFDGQREDAFPGEDRVEIPSVKVPTYDLKPEMSAREITKEVVNRIHSGIYDFILINFANPDIVGHTGVLKAGIKACEVVDECLGTVVSETMGAGGICIITADHGNAEEMINPATGEIDTEHSSNPVPFIIVDKKYLQEGKCLSQGILADVAPTLLEIMGLNGPDLMTGRSLLSR